MIKKYNRQEPKQEQRYTMNYQQQRKSYYRFFEGDGMDVGPFDKPFIEQPSARNLNIKYVDHYHPEELKKLFPEIKDFNPVIPDYICDVSSDGLKFAANESYDFIIYSHICEHVANPFFIIQEAYRALKTGGVLYLSVPDGRFSDDKGRKLTSYEDLITLYNNDVRKISDDSVQAYLESPVISKVEWVKKYLENPPADPSAVYEHCRERSFHVQVWDSLSFFQHISRFIAENMLKVSLLELDIYDNNFYENILILRKSDSYHSNIKADIEMLYEKRKGDGHHRMEKRLTLKSIKTGLQRRYKSIYK